jgi:uncharacterized Fe-S cluster protein YjdI
MNVIVSMKWFLYYNSKRADGKGKNVKKKKGKKIRIFFTDAMCEKNEDTQKKID